MYLSKLDLPTGYFYAWMLGNIWGIPVLPLRARHIALFCSSDSSIRLLRVVPPPPLFNK